jgi:histone acetyltransferase (RNA polymerase elongator complex component)
MQNDVLAMNLRGHTAEDVEKASALIKEYGFSLGLQMMTGLYGQKDYMAYAVDTARKFVALQPDTVRIYPTVTLKNTMLEQVFFSGEYMPPTVEETVEICAYLMEIFDNANIKIIKMGLHADTGLEDKIVAGPYHPAFRELCLAQQKLLKIKQQLTNTNRKSITIKVNPKQLSQWKGQKNSNIQKLAQMGYTAQIVADSTVEADNFIID